MKVRVEFETTDETGEVSTSFHVALMEMTEQGMRLSYVEDVSGDGKKTRNTLLVSEKNLRVLRSGELQSDFMYGHDLQHNTVYQTPYGAFPVTVHTKRFSHSAEGVDYEGKAINQIFRVLLELDYTLTMGQDAPMYVQMKIQIASI